MATFTPPPTLAGFTTFVGTYMNIPTSVLPTNSVFLSDAFEAALHTVNSAINCVDPWTFTKAVYNLGGDIIINTAIDPTPLVVYQNDLPYFQYFRKQFNIDGFVSGVITSASDEGTSEGMVVSDAFSNMGISDLQNLKTPYGRAYLAIAQKYGSVWGIS
jgi:hypothetical protein